jgi:hypothetical protein
LSPRDPGADADLRLDDALSGRRRQGEAVAHPSSTHDDDYPSADLIAASQAQSVADRHFALSPPIQHAVERFAPLTLSELADYALLNRTDTKYIFTEQDAIEIFAAVQPSYRVLEVQGLRAGHYFTQYYDTPDLHMYRAHHNGIRDRYKVRTRTYLDTGICFLEIKRKNNHERTIKNRMQVPLESSLIGPLADFVEEHTPYPVSGLSDSVSTEFLRVTLVSKENAERLTLDFGFCFQWAHLRGALPGLVIAEVKQPKFSTSSGFVRQLLARHIEPTAFSKFCIALVVLDPNVRYNHFKPLLMRLQRLLRPYSDHPGSVLVSGRMDAPPTVAAHAAEPSANPPAPARAHRVESP